MFFDDEDCCDDNVDCDGDADKMDDDDDDDHSSQWTGMITLMMMVMEEMEKMMIMSKMGKILMMIIFSQWPDHQGRDGDTSLPLPALLKTRWQISVFIGSDSGAVLALVVIS